MSPDWVTPALLVGLFLFIYKEFSSLKERVTRLESHFDVRPGEDLFYSGR